MTLSHAWDAALGELVVTARQTGRFGAYRFRLPVEVRGADGARSVVVIEVAAAQESVVRTRVELNGVPGAVSFDPWGDVLAVLRTP